MTQKSPLSLCFSHSETEVVLGVFIGKGGTREKGGTSG